jgi:metal-responsive CopG/Arc/MetJ family transcriptional regulator
MEQITIRLQENQLESIESEASEHDASRSEYIRELLDRGIEYEELKDRVKQREKRIEELEEQLAKRSQVEDKIDEVALAVREEEPEPPFFVRWIDWYRSRED